MVNDPNVIANLNNNQTSHTIILGHSDINDTQNANEGDSGSPVFYTIKKGFGGGRQYVLLGTTIGLVPQKNPYFTYYLVKATKIIDYLANFIYPAINQYARP